MAWNWQQAQCSRRERKPDGAARQGAPSPPSTDGPRAVDPFPDSQDYLALVLVTRGLEDVAMDYLVREGVVPSVAHLALLPRPDSPALGVASVDKVVVRLGSDDAGLAAAVARLQQAPVVQAVLAFVAAAVGLQAQGGWEERVAEEGEEEGAAAERADVATVRPEDRWAALRRGYRVVPTGVLDQLAQLLGSTTRWPMAEAVLRAAGVGRVRRFRASCVASACGDAGFDCTDVMRAVGGGGLSAHAFGADPRWKVDLQRYDVELCGLLFHDAFACGLLLGGEWRRNTNADKYSFSSVPYGERAGRPYTAGDHQPWFMPRLRQSTALLLLILAGLRPGERLLDPMGGSGTIAIEAAVHFAGVSAVSSDRNPAATSAAIKNCVLARPHLAAGSSLRAEDWDARDLSRLEAGSVDRVVADMPFGNKCRWDAAASLPAMLGEVARVLRRGGRAVLLTKGYRRIEALLAGGDAGEAGGDPGDPASDSEDADGAGEDGAGTDGGSAAEAAGPVAPGAGSPVAGPREPAEEASVEPGRAEECRARRPPAPLDRLSVLERRPVAVGGYLCYALVLERG